MTFWSLDVQTSMVVRDVGREHVVDDDAADERLARAPKAEHEANGFPGCLLGCSTSASGSAALDHDSALLVVKPSEGARPGARDDDAHGDARQKVMDLADRILTMEEGRLIDDKRAG